MLAAMTLDEFLSAHVQGNINIIIGWLHENEA